MCTVLLPPGDNPIAVNKYIKLDSQTASTSAYREHLVLWLLIKGGKNVKKDRVVLVRAMKAYSMWRGMAPLNLNLRMIWRNVANFKSRRFKLRWKDHGTDWRLSTKKQKTKCFLIDKQKSFRNTHLRGETCSQLAVSVSRGDFTNCKTEINTMKRPRLVWSENYHYHCQQKASRWERTLKR